MNRQRQYDRKHPGPTSVLPELMTSTAYRGYLVRFNAFVNMWQISRGGFHIGSAQTLTEARQTIDLVAD